MTAMTGRGDNDTSVQSKVEHSVIKVPAMSQLKRAAVGDPHGGEIPMELKP